MFAIYDDIINDLQKTGGISVYWQNLKNNLNDKLEIECYNGGNLKRDIKIPLLIHRYLDFYERNKAKHIFHSSYYRVSKNKNALNVVTVHDFVYEKYSKGVKRLLHQFQKKKAIFNAKKIICISENTKRDLLEFYPEIEENRIRVIYHGVSNAFFKVNDLEIKNENKAKNIIFVGQRKGYKNFKTLLDSLLILKNYNLILVGGGKLSSNELKNLKKIKFKHYQNISDNKLNLLYNNSFVLIYPSLYEGFGLPILESMKAGCPVICNDGSSTKEIGSRYVIKDKISTNFIIKSIKRLEQENFRNELITNGINFASTFTWEKTANQTFNLYKELWDEY